MPDNFVNSSTATFRKHLSSELQGDALFEMPAPGSVEALFLDGPASDVRNALAGELPVQLGEGAMAPAPESSIENLYQLASMDVSLMKEREFSSLNCGLGFISWADDLDGEIRQAPLVLIPLRIQGLGTKQLAVQQTGKPVLNDALLRRIGLTRSALPSDPLAFQPKRSHGKVRGFSGAAAIGLFNNVGRALSERLAWCLDQSLDLPLISMMLGASSTSSPQEKPAPGKLACYLPCDSDQFAAVKAIAEGQSILVWGPPGTGKTQTITNVILQRLERRERVLLLSDAAHALDPVLARLRELCSPQIVDLRATNASGVSLSAGNVEEFRDELARRSASERPEVVVATPGGYLMAVPPHWMFDLIICDEASRTRFAYTLPALAAGHQLMIVGDHKQCGPSRIIKLTEQGTIADIGDVSLIDAARSAKLPSVKLTRHYRSRHPSLINFSNERFYACTLKTVPSPHHRQQYGCILHKVPAGSFAAGTNAVEATALVNRVLEQIRRSDTRIGIIAMTHKQCVLISKLLADKEPAYRNLITVLHANACQGVEREIIYVSLTHGPDEGGAQRNNFGILSDLGGDQVLNVCLTRARIRTEVFSSIDTTGLNPDAPSAIGALADFLTSYEEQIRFESLPPAAFKYPTWQVDNTEFFVRQYDNILIYKNKPTFLSPTDKWYAVQLTGTQDQKDDTAQREQLINNGWNVACADHRLINGEDHEYYRLPQIREVLRYFNWPADF